MVAEATTPRVDLRSDRYASIAACTYCSSSFVCFHWDFTRISRFQISDFPSGPIYTLRPWPLFSIETNGQLSPHLTQEWLLTNGLGGFSSSSVVGCNTRRYHGLLCAATLPPVGRVLALNCMGEAITLDGDHDTLFELSVNQFREVFHPHGWHYLRKFELDDIARWEYDVEGVRIVKEVQMLWRQNAIGIRYTVKPARPRKVRLSLSSFFTLRDYHGLRHAGDTPLQPCHHRPRSAGECLQSIRHPAQRCRRIPGQGGLVVRRLLQHRK